MKVLTFGNNIVCIINIYIFCNHVEVYKLFDVLEKSSKTDPKGIC